MTNPLITVDQLAELDPQPALADVRWYLGEPTGGHHAYHAGHLPDAVYLNLDLHLSAPHGPGRHPLPTRAAFAATMGRMGFGQDQVIVAYDDAGGANAARLWWMLRDIGHDQVHVLDGGITAWRGAGRPVDAHQPARMAAPMAVRPSATRQLDRDELRRGLGTLNLLDARAAERYRGDEEPVDVVAGHIPTALSATMADNLRADGTFRDRQSLHERFAALGVGDDRETVVYCGSGVAACHNALAIVLAGLPEPILYPGSWSDWSTSGGEVALGAEPGTVDP